jgi:putative phosphoesterase
LGPDGPSCNRTRADHHAGGGAVAPHSPRPSATFRIVRRIMIIGVISDTHGLPRPEAVATLRGADRIVHAGDVGSPEILTSLAALAPLTAVRGNNDKGAWARALPVTEVVDGGGGLLVYVIHDVAELDLDPAAGGFRVVVTGHSHRPVNDKRDGVLWFNPGSAGPRRFRLPVAVGRLIVEQGKVRGEIVTIG